MGEIHVPNFPTMSKNTEVNNRMQTHEGLQWRTGKFPSIGRKCCEITRLARNSERRGDIQLPKNLQNMAAKGSSLDSSSEN